MALNLSKNQQLFAATLAQATGLPYDLAASWVINEEPQGANATVGQGNQDWLNVANTNSGFKGSASPWSDPVTAAKDTAAWMQGKWADPGFGYASSPIQKIIPAYKSGGLPAAMAAIQYHGPGGWSTGGETALPSLYSQESGAPAPKIPNANATGSEVGPTGFAIANTPGTSSGGVPAPKGSTLLDMFGSQDASSNPSQSATWNALGSLLKARGQ